MQGQAAREATAETSRYRFEEVKRGFRISGEGRNPVTVVRGPLGITVAYKACGKDGSASPIAFTLGFYEFHKLCGAVSCGLMAGWAPAKESCWTGLAEWARQQTERAIAGRMRACWREMLREVPARVLEVQRALFAAAFCAPPLAHCPELYRDRWVVQDVCRYRAAALSVANVPLLGAVRRRRLTGVGASVEELFYDPFAEDVQSPDESPDACVEHLREWLPLYSCDGRAYRSLNRTLMHLPGSISPNLLRYLIFVRLPRPMEHRLELLLTLCWAEANSVFSNAPEENTRIALHARAPQIAEAMARVSAHLRVAWSPRRSSEVGALARFLSDCQDAHHGNLVGLADRAIAWHRQFARQVEEDALAGVDDSAPTARPALPLPGQPGITFLDTVSAVVAEGARMGHCIAGYVQPAVEGQCYLFHIEYRGEAASVQVDPCGRVVQAQGPRNQANAASAWGRRVLGRWGRALAARRQVT